MKMKTIILLLISTFGICRGSVIDDVRLVEGKNAMSGRVEVLVNGEWGTVCDDLWDDDDAEVVCRYLGYSGSLAARGLAYYGVGTGSILLDNVRCDGTEMSLNDCDKNVIGDNDCSHSEDAGVECLATTTTTTTTSTSNPPPAPSGSKFRNDYRCGADWLAPNGEVAECDPYDSFPCCSAGNYCTFSHCRCDNCIDYRSDLPKFRDDLRCGGEFLAPNGRVAQCNSKGYYPCCSPLNVCGYTAEDCDCDQCIDHRNEYQGIRLAGGSTPNVGRVEVKVNGEWGTVCDTYWYYNEAHIACRELGYPRAIAARKAAYFGQGTGKIWLDNVHCGLLEPSLDDCQKNNYGHHYCDHSNDAGVECEVFVPTIYTPPIIESIRLVGGSTPNVGRVEVLINGEWGTVCDDDWNINDANVICRELGYPGATVERIRGYFGEGSGRIWLDNVQCTGSEDSIYYCPQNNFGEQNCAHYEDAGVECAPVEPQSTSSPTSGSRTTVTPILAAFREDYQCGGDWFAPNGEVAQCNPDGIYPCCSPYNWCGITSAHCDCEDCVDYRVIDPPVGTSKFREDLHCGGSWNAPNGEVAECDPESGSPCCSPFNSCGISAEYCYCEDCMDYRQVIQDIRLVGGDTNNVGRVEVMARRLWGTVCDDDWDFEDAEVVCRMLGYTGAIEPTYAAFFGEGYGLIWLDDVECVGTEESINDCPKSRVGTSNCLHSQDAGVKCMVSLPKFRDDLLCGGEWLAPNGRVAQCDPNGYYPCCSPLTVCSFQAEDCDCDQCIDYRNEYQGIRLAGGSTPNVGRVEVQVNGEWGTVCDTHWSYNEAQIVCRELGYPSAIIARKDAYFGQGTGKIWFDNVVCGLLEPSLDECQKNNYGHNDCRHSSDAGVECEVFVPTSSSTRVPTVLAAYREDYQCGGDWLAPNGEVAQCNPDGIYPCCSPYNWCGITPDHCDCEGCIDYRITEPQTSTTMQPILSSYREDHRCGDDWLAPNGEVAECDPDSAIPCCSYYNWCGYKDLDCDCHYCVDYRKVPYSYRDDYRCEGGWIAPNGEVAKCKVDEYPCCSSDNWCSKRPEHCSCEACADYRHVPYSYRDDYRCEGGWIAPNGEVAKCKVDEYPCCSSDNWCSKKPEHCSCEACADYRHVIEGIRLVGGITPNVGRVEVFVFGIWGTICDDLWDINDANVVCRQLGFTGANRTRVAAYFGEGRGTIWFDDVQCSGTEESLHDCPKSKPRVNNCLPAEDAGVECTPFDTQSTTRTVEPQTSTTMQPILSSYREDHRCGGDWLASNGKVARCDPDSVLPCCSSSNWCGYISYQDCNCDSCVDYRIDAGVECIPSESSSTTTTVRATYRDDNRCEGDWLAPNGNVAKCDIESYPCCTSDNWCSESVDDCRCEGCTDYRNVIEDIRLFGGLTPNVGRLEVKVYGEWGTVCDDSWELRDAAVVCRVLGFTAARTVRNHAYYGEGSGKIWYGDVECSGSEESLNDCPKSNVGVHNCLHSDDAGVVCTSYYTQSGPNPADLRYRKDNLCGYPWRAISGDVAECNPRGDNPCCGPNNQCGNTRQDCFCTDCIDYRDTI